MRLWAAGSIRGAHTPLLALRALRALPWSRLAYCQSAMTSASVFRVRVAFGPRSHSMTGQGQADGTAGFETRLRSPRRWEGKMATSSDLQVFPSCFLESALIGFPQATSYKAESRIPL